MLAFSSDGNES